MVYQKIGFEENNEARQFISNVSYEDNKVWWLICDF